MAKKQDSPAGSGAQPPVETKAIEKAVSVKKMLHTIMIPEDPNRKEGSGPEYVPVNVLGSIPEMQVCEDCGGEGCDACGGMGKVPMMTVCYRCEGKKSIIVDRVPRACPVCGGKGEIGIQTPVEFHLSIRRGVPVDNVPEYALGVLKTAIEKRYHFENREKNAVMKMRTTLSYPFSILESYETPKPEGAAQPAGS